MKKIELLSPAGDFECLKAAISNGADAVYLGGKNFSARAFAQNFDQDELLKAIEYAHLRNARIFVTLNTLLNEYEMENAIRMADFYYKAHVDALLIQDLGLYYVLKERYPDFELHCSTQMHVHNVQGVRNARKMGFKRVVLARESTLELIQEACKEAIEIEVFVHGAICVSYSGQCLMSAYTKDRSANKGACAQCCRLQYRLYDDRNEAVPLHTSYPLSAKDMMLLYDVPALIKAGVSSLKIEGRMKSAAYVGYVTSLYRKAIDSFYAGKEYRISDQELQNLKALFNREFTNDLLYGRNGLSGQKTPNHLGILIGKVLNYKHPYTYLKLSSDLHQFDGIRIGDYGCIVNMLYKDELLTKEGKAGEIVAIKTEKSLKGDVYKTYDHLLEEKIKAIPEKQIPLKMHITLEAGKQAAVELSCGKDKYTYLSEKSPEKALKAPLDVDKIIRQFSKLKETAYIPAEITVVTKDAFMTIGDLNEIRRKAIEAFNEYRLHQFHRENIFPEIHYQELQKETKPSSVHKKGDELFIDENRYSMEYVINPQSRYFSDEDIVISEIGDLLNPHEHKIAYFTLNCSNSFCYEFFKKLGYEHIILSSELNDEQIRKLIEAYEQRNGITIHPIVFTQGHLPLMYIRTDPFEGHLKEGRNYHLSDGYNRYEISYHENILELQKEIHKSRDDLQEKCSFFISD